MKINYIVLSVLTCLGFSGINAQENLIPNGGFESWVSETEPENFTPFNTGTLYVNFHLDQESETVKTGSFSARHTSQDGTQTIGGELAQVEPGETYRISYWFLDNDVKATTRIWSNWRSGSTDLTDHADLLKPGNDGFSENNAEWQKMEFELVAPATATHFRLQARTYRGSQTQVGGYIYYDDFSVVKISGTASSESHQIQGLKMYPNPVNDGKVYISSNHNLSKEIEIFDILGKKVIDATLTNNDFVNVERLTSGIYLVKITEDKKTATQKLIIR